jgi:glycosyltransferase involved in cell wall biosynthesis
VAPLVSVVIPCYNAARWVDAAVESALRQTYSNVEVIVVDDGSTDDSAAIIANKYPNVTLICSPNRGPSAARNQGLGAAHGEWTQFLDADDLLHPDKLFLSLEVYAPRPDVQFAWAPHASASEAFCLADIATCSRSEIRLSRNALEATYAPSTAVFRTSFLKQVGEWDESLERWVDLEYHARIAAQQPVYARLSDPLYFYREHSGARISNANRSHANVSHALKSLILAEKALARSAITPREYRSYLWPFYVHLARSSAIRGDKKTFRQLLGKAAELRGSRRFTLKCAMATASANAFGVNLTSTLVEGFLSLKHT